MYKQLLLGLNNAVLAFLVTQQSLIKQLLYRACFVVHLKSHRNSAGQKLNLSNEFLVTDELGAS